MGENWELTRHGHFIPMEYFHQIVEMLQTFRQGLKVTISNVTSSIFCVKLEMLLMVTPKKHPLSCMASRRLITRP